MCSSAPAHGGHGACSSCHGRAWRAWRAGKSGGRRVGEDGPASADGPKVRRVAQKARKAFSNFHFQ
jgi:hypothetical protein